MSIFNINLFGEKKAEDSIDEATFQQIKQIPVHSLQASPQENSQPASGPTPTPVMPSSPNPFLNQNPSVSVQIPTPTSSQVPLQPLTKASDQLPASPARTVEQKISLGPAPSSGSGKFWAFFLTFLVIIGLAGGGYYFWMFGQQPRESFVGPAVPPTRTEPVKIETDATASSKPKYLNLDLQKSSTEEIMETIKAYARNAGAQSKALEFIVTDMQNNPTTFSNFAKKIGIVFPAEISSNLSENFSLYVYNDTATIGIGLAIDMKNENALKSTLLSAEKDLASVLNPILLNKPAGNAIPAFNNGSYKDVSVRYYNFPDGNGLCIDYAFSQGKLLIATTLNTFRSVVDLL